MKITYDAQVDILMVTLDEDTKPRARGEEIADGGAYIDFAEDGTIQAIEIFGASKKYPIDKLLGTRADYAPMSLAEAAQVSGISYDALKKACERGSLKGKKIGRNWTVSPEALSAYQAGRKRVGSSRVLDDASEAAKQVVKKADRERQRAALMDDIFGAEVVKKATAKR